VIARSLLVTFVVAISTAYAAPAIEIRASCAEALARDPAHVRTLRGELAHALSDARASPGTTLDASLVRLAAIPVGGEIEVRAEVRAMLSDGSGRVRWTSTSRATVRGSSSERVLLQRDAVGAAARDLARSVRVHCASST
jgi:hypothetical protein